ncbi:MAG: hypothetical protein ACFB21_15265 [Opitutales bacterium]
MRVGIIDIGSNSIKLLIAESGSSLAMRYETTWETRIGTGMGKTKPYITREAMHAAQEAVSALMAEAEEYEVEQFCLVTTAAVREASNREAFVELIQEATGERLRVLTGDEEAAYIAYGIMSDPVLSTFDEMCLIDLGGGSLEAIYVADREVRKKVSLPLGAVRLSEDLLRNSAMPMRSEEMRAITRAVQEAFQGSGFEFPKRGVVLAGSGGALTIARRIRTAWLGRSMDSIGNKLSLNFLEYLFLELASLTQKERSRIPHLPPERADIMPTALLVLITVAGIARQKSYLHSMYNLRYGIAHSIHQHYLDTGEVDAESGPPFQAPSTQP